MSDRANLVRVLTASTGTSTMTLGTAYSALFMTSAEANMVDGRTYTYLIVDGNNWELGKGVYTASGTTLSRITVLASRISGTLGTTKITLSGTAQVRIIESADDMGALRGTRAVVSTSDTLAQTDLGRAVTYSNASAIAVSLAQAGASSQFLDGWSAWVQNIGAGAVTITPATSTINAVSTLVLAQNLGAFIWSDGTNYHAYIIPITKPLLAANNLSDVTNVNTSLNNLTGVSYGAAQSQTTAQKAQARANIAIANTKQTFTSSSGTYTTPSNCVAIRIRLAGAGGGGGGSGSASGGNGGAGGNTTFSTLTGSGGGGGIWGGIGGAGGAASGGNLINAAGNSALAGPWFGTSQAGGGAGAPSAFFAGAGSPGSTVSAGGAGGTNTGGGGGGGGVGGGNTNSGGGGASGGCVEHFITSPAGTYSYAVGAAGTAGTAGTSGFAGGAGGSGYIVVEEYY